MHFFRFQIENIQKKIISYFLLLLSGSDIIRGERVRELGEVQGGWIVAMLSLVCRFLEPFFGLQKRRLREQTASLLLRLHQAEKNGGGHDLVQPALSLSKTLKKEGMVQESEELFYHLIALLYRNNLLLSDKKPKKITKETLSLIESWKAKQGIYENRSPNEGEIKRFKNALHFTHAASFILSSKTLLDPFLSWILRDGLDPAVFFQFPYHTKKIIDCNLSGRLAFLKDKGMKIIQGVGGKGLYLLMEGKYVNVLDGSKTHTFCADYTLTVDEIFQVFKDKNRDCGNLEVLGGGISNWHSQKLARFEPGLNAYRPLDLLNKMYWKELPDMEILSLKEAKERVGSFLDGRNFACALCATRSTRTLDFEGTHAFLQAAVPNGGGTYKIMNFGKFAVSFPETFYQNMTVFALNLHASISYPDENIFYTHRQFKKQTFLLSEEQGFKLLEKVRCDMIQSSISNLVYQIESENCAKWAQETLQSAIGYERVPNLFYMNLLKSEPQSVLKYLFSFIKMLPRKLGAPLFARMHLLFGAAKETLIIQEGEAVSASLKKHRFFESLDVYLPSFLCHQIEQGLLGPAIKERDEDLSFASRFVKLIASIGLMRTFFGAPIFQAGGVDQKEKVQKLHRLLHPLFFKWRDFCRGALRKSTNFKEVFHGFF